MAEACSQAAVVARDHHHHDDASDTATATAGDEAVYGELREPLSLCYAAADKVATLLDTPY